MLDLFSILKCSIEIEPIVPAFTHLIVSMVKVIIPIILIAFGMIDLAKAVMSNDDKVMKEAQTKLIKRIIYAVIIFFVVAIVQFVFSTLAQAGSDANDQTTVDGNDISGCINCFINNKGCGSGDDKTEAAA